MLSIPVAGTWISASVFGGEFPGHLIIGRFYIAHVLLIPGSLLALISVHLGLVFKQKHTQWPGPMRTNENVVGERMFPRYALKQGGFFMTVFGVVALMAGLFQINPIWLFGPYRASEVSSASQPDWYVMFMDGLVRLMPNWQITLPIYIGGGHGYSIPPLFWPAVVGLGALTTVPMVVPVHRGPADQGPAHPQPARAAARRPRAGRRRARWRSRSSSSPRSPAATT